MAAEYLAGLTPCWLAAGMISKKQAQSLPELFESEVVLLLHASSFSYSV